MLEFIDSRPVQRTKTALLDAFVELVLERRYDQLRVSDIISRAGVGRSTFYDHYDGKDELLKEGVSGPFGVLADMLTHRHDEALLLRTVEHFWANRRIGNVLLSGHTRPILFGTLATLIEDRLVAHHRASHLTVPAPLLAAQLAGAQLALISAWLGGQASATPAAIANTLFTWSFPARASLREA